MIRAAGILYQTKDRRALFLKRSALDDAAGMWCLPGGKIEDGETPADAAVRESAEEIGFTPAAESLRELCRRIAPAVPAAPAPTSVDAPEAPAVAEAAPLVDFTTFVVELDEEFTPKLDAEHVAWTWAPMDSPPEPLHPGCRVALARDGMDEQQVAQAIAAGELTSPQKFVNAWLFAMRVTGTGLAYRHKHDEYVWRDPSLYMTPEFLQRCSGLPVIVEHPEKATLDTREYSRRNVGSIIYAYLRPEAQEVWGIARIIDEPTAKLLMEEQMSTSPSVVFTDPEVNEKLETENGPLLVEGKPSLLDHLAICEQGVWDKMGPPRGIESATIGEVSMAEKEPEDMKKDDNAKADANGKMLDKILSCVDSIATACDSMGKRMDALEARMGKADDDEEEKKDDDNEVEEKQPDSEEEEKDEHKKSDDDDDDDSEKDDEDIEEELEKDKPRAVAADKKRKDSKKADKARKDDDDDDDDDDDKKADSVTRGPSLTSRLGRLERVLRGPTDEDFRMLADAQEKADHVFSAFGDSAGRPMAGETTLQYRLRMARKLQVHSPVWKNTKLDVLAKADSAAFDEVEKAIYADAMKAAERPVDLKPGLFREIRRSDSTGRQITTFAGNGSFVRQFKPAVRRVRWIEQNHGNRA